MSMYRVYFDPNVRDQPMDVEADHSPSGWSNVIWKCRDGDRTLYVNLSHVVTIVALTPREASS